MSHVLVFLASAKALGFPSLLLFKTDFNPNPKFYIRSQATG